MTSREQQVRKCKFIVCMACKDYAQPTGANTASSTHLGRLLPELRSRLLLRLQRLRLRGRGVRPLALLPLLVLLRVGLVLLPVGHLQLRRQRGVLFRRHLLRHVELRLLRRRRLLRLLRLHWLLEGWRLLLLHGGLVGRLLRRRRLLPRRLRLLRGSLERRLLLRRRRPRVPIWLRRGLLLLRHLHVHAHSSSLLVWLH